MLNVHGREFSCELASVQLLRLELWMYLNIKSHWVTYEYTSRRLSSYLVLFGLNTGIPLKLCTGEPSEPKKRENETAHVSLILFWKNVNIPSNFAIIMNLQYSHTFPLYFKNGKGHTVCVCAFLFDRKNQWPLVGVSPQFFSLKMFHIEDAPWCSNSSKKAYHYVVFTSSCKVTFIEYTFVDFWLIYSDYLNS